MLPLLKLIGKEWVIWPTHVKPSGLIQIKNFSLEQMRVYIHYFVIKSMDVKPQEVAVGLILKVSHVLAISTTLSQLVSIGGANDLLSMAVKLMASLKRKE